MACTAADRRVKELSLDGLVLEEFEENLSQTGEDDVNDSGIKDEDELHGEVEGV